MALRVTLLGLATGIDTTEIAEAIREFRTLLRDGEGIPRHLVLRIRKLISHGGARNGRLVRRNDFGGVHYEPGHELLCILAELRAIRGA